MIPEDLRRIPGGAGLGADGGRPVPGVAKQPAADDRRPIHPEPGPQLTGSHADEAGDGTG